MTNRYITLTAADFDRLSSLVNSRQTRLSYGPQTGSLQEELHRGRVVPPAEVSRRTVTMNSQVVLRDLKSGEEETYRLVYPQEADIDEGKLSVLAPLGTAILGAKAGDVVKVNAPAGVRKIRIERILYQPEAAGHHHL